MQGYFSESSAKLREGAGESESAFGTGWPNKPCTYAPNKQQSVLRHEEFCDAS